MDGGDDVESLFEGMELFTPSSQFADSSDNTPAILPPSKATLITAPPAEVSESMSEALDENLFSDLTIVSPVQHVPDAVTHPSPLSSSSTSVMNYGRQVSASRRKKRAAVLRIGYGRHEIHEDEDDTVSQQSTDSVSQLSDSVNQAPDSITQVSDSSTQVSDSVVHQPSESSAVGSSGRLELVKDQIEGKLNRARDLAGSVTAARKNAIRKRRQASENLRSASTTHDELEKQLEEAIEAEDFDAAERISESLAAAERDRLALMTLLRQAESDCDAIESKMEEVLLSQIAAEEESASLLRQFCTDAENDAASILENAEAFCLEEMGKWHSCSEDVEVRKVELDIESVIVDNVRLSLNDSLEGSVEQEMKEKEMLSKKKEHLSDELQELLALVKAKEKEIDENDFQIKVVEERINNVVFGYKELQASMDKMLDDVQAGLSQIDMETEALSKKKIDVDEFVASEKERGAKLRELVSVSADEACEYEEVIKLRKTLMSYVSKTREERAKLVNIEEKLSEEVQKLQEELSGTRESVKRDVSPRSLARSVVKRLSHAQGKSKAPSSYDPIRIQDVYGGNNGKTLDSSFDVFANLLLVEHQEPVNGYYTEGDANSELEKKCKEAEKRVKLLSEEHEEQKFLSDCEFDISSLVGDIRQMEEERVGLAFEVLSLLRSQMDERASAREEIRRAKSDCDLHVNRLEKEKSELQFGLEKELDRRSSEWTSKFENLQNEEKRLRERVRELAEHNVSLQREVSTFREKETERIDMIRHLDETVRELSARTEETRGENLYLMQSLSKLQESCSGATEDLHCLRGDFEEKDMECKELHKSVTRFSRTCGEQEKTIQGLRDCLSEETKKQKPSEMCKRLQMEQMRLTGVEFSLRKEIESMKLEADALRHENICLRNRAIGNGDEADAMMMSFKLDNEMKMRVCLLQDQGMSMLNESTQLCYKFLKFFKEKLAHSPDSQSMSNGLNEQFLIESEMRVHGIRRGTESLKRSLQTVTSLLLEKANEVASNAARPSEPNNQSVEKFLRAELRAESLVTSLLREKLYSKEEEIEQLQAEVAAGVRGNEVLQREIQNVLDNLSVNNHQLKDLKLQMVKKDENSNRLENNLQEAAKDLASMKVTLPKVLSEREEMWKEVKECRKRNMDLESEKEILKKKVENLEEDTLIKEGQITILKDTLGSKPFDLLSSPDFSYNDFLVQ